MGIGMGMGTGMGTGMANGNGNGRELLWLCDIYFMGWWVLLGRTKGWKGFSRFKFSSFTMPRFLLVLFFFSSLRSVNQPASQPVSQSVHFAPTTDHLRYQQTDRPAACSQHRQTKKGTRKEKKRDRRNTKAREEKTQHQSMHSSNFFIFIFSPVLLHTRSLGGGLVVQGFKGDEGGSCSKLKTRGWLVVNCCQ